MDIMQFAGHVDLSEMGSRISGVEGPFPFLNGASGNALIWLKNGRGVSVLKNGAPGHTDDTDLVEMAVIREIADTDADKWHSQTPWDFDWSTPVARKVLLAQTVADVVEALRVLDGMPDNDPLDLR